jgi:hypothetical protein
MKKLERKDASGSSWNAIIELSLEEVFAVIAESGLRLHEAYTRYHSSRVSCAFCIMGSENDLAASSTCEDNQPVYRQMVMLEADSTFAFQSNRWLADVAPDLLDEHLCGRIAESKIKAIRREEIESRIPEHLLFVKGWPTVMPTESEAELLASVRRGVSEMIGLNANCLTGTEVLERYDWLMNEKAVRGCTA